MAQAEVFPTIALEPPKRGPIPEPVFQLVWHEARASIFFKSSPGDFMCSQKQKLLDRGSSEGYLRSWQGECNPYSCLLTPKADGPFLPFFPASSVFHFLLDCFHHHINKL